MGNGPFPNPSNALYELVHNHELSSIPVDNGFQGTSCTASHNRPQFGPFDELVHVEALELFVEIDSFEGTIQVNSINDTIKIDSFCLEVYKKNVSILQAARYRIMCFLSCFFLLSCRFLVLTKHLV
jgi:hypothetical protein